MKKPGKILVPWTHVKLALNVVKAWNNGYKRSVCHVDLESIWGIWQFFTFCLYANMADSSKGIQLKRKIQESDLLAFQKKNS